MLNIFFETQRCNCIFYHLAKLRWHSCLKSFLVNDNDLLSCKVNTMAADVLLRTEGARASEVMILTSFSRNIPAVLSCIYRKVSNISCIKSPNLNDSRHVLHLSLPPFIEARCWVENEDVVGAAPTGDLFYMEFCGEYISENIKILIWYGFLWGIYFTKYKNVFIFSINSQQRNSTGHWKPSSWKARVCISYIINIMIVDDLATLGARALAAVVLTWGPSYWDISMLKSMLPPYR